MKVLVIGSGGREHALVWKLRQSPRVKKIFCAPGNAGISRMAECVDISATDVSTLLRFAKKENIDLTIVGPESSLMAGVVDLFERNSLRIFGPDKRAAVLEGSKVFTKKFLQNHSIPSAGFSVFRKRKTAVDYIKRMGGPLVIKADGLAAGKGVIVARTVEEGIAAIETIMKEKAFGDAGNRVVIEDFMEGEEASFIAFTDGKTVLPLPTSQDHKPIFDDDKGPNTGGMGAYSPAPVVTDKIHRQVMEKIMLPAVRAMRKEGRAYKGVLYAGLMIKDGTARVVEFNCRFGDPEAQPLLIRLKNDLVDIIDAVIDEKLHTIELEIDPRPSVCVVMSSAGYPGSYEKGHVISGLTEESDETDVVVFHAGTSRKGRQVVTSGGRVLGVTALGETLSDAVDSAYRTVKTITWEGCFYRSDIGKKALQRKEIGKKPVQDRPEKKGPSPLVGIVMGSDSDLPVLEAAAAFLKSMDIPYEMTVASAHRSPERASVYAKTAHARGLRIIIAGAGMAAHLAGVLASHTNVPVIGVPIDVAPLNGLDALLSTVQMPPGIPVATMGIGKAGAKNAAVLAARILAITDMAVAKKLEAFTAEMARAVESKAEAMAARKP